MTSSEICRFFAFTVLVLLLLSGCSENESPTAQKGTSPLITNPSPGKSATEEYMPCSPPPSGLISWWPGDGNAHDLIGVNHGTLENGATFSTGFVTSGNGLAFSLDGVNDILNFGSPQTLDDVLNGVHDFTFSAWYVLEDLSTFRTLFTKGNIGSCCDYSGTLSFTYDVYVGAFTFQIYDASYGNGLVKTWPASAFPLNEWSHFALVYHSFLRDAEVYINGQRLTGSYFHSGYDGSVIENILDKDFKVGGEFLASSNAWPGTHYWKGLIDEAKVFDRRLTEEEILAEYIAGEAGMCKYVSVDIDIKPRSCPNPLNTKSKGVVPVAVLGTANFHVDDINLSSLRLAGVAPLRGTIDDVAAPSPNRQGDCDCTTAGADGFNDLVLAFDTELIVAGLGFVNDGDTVPLTLMGNLNDGTPIQGLDCVLIKKK